MIIISLWRETKTFLASDEVTFRACLIGPKFVYSRIGRLRIRVSFSHNSENGTLGRFERPS